MKNYILFFLIVFGSFLQAQTKSDSLITLFNKTSDWNKKAVLTYEFCKLNLGSNPNKCMELYSMVEEHELEITDSLQLFNMYNVKGVLHQYIHNVDSSNSYLKKAFDIALQLKDSSLLIKPVSNLSINFRNEGNYKKAIEYALISLNYNKSHNDTIAWANNLTDIGNSFIFLKNYREGMNYQRNALKLFIAKNYWRGVGNSYSSIAYVFSKKEKLDSTIYYTELALEAHQKSGNIYSIVNAKRSLCAYYNKLGRDPQEIYDCHTQVLEYDLEIGDKQGIMMDYLNISMSLNNLKRYKESIELKKKALTLAEELKDYRIMAECYESLAKTSFNLKDYKKGYNYLEKAQEINDSLIHIDVQNAALETEKKFKVAEKEKELIKTKQQKAQAELKVATRNNQLIIVASLVFIILLLGGFIFYRTKQKQKSKLAQIRIEEQQKGLSAVIHAQEEERKRIAKDLHDGIVQQLGGLKLGLQKVFSGKENDETNKIVEILDNSAQELRELSHKMMPRALGELGLIPALEDMLENSLGNSTIIHQFEHFGINSRFSEKIEIAIYRISQELINNVIKHSGATKVNVQLFKTGNDVILIVEDNGQGIKDNKKDGIGFMNISSRLDTINGKVNFEPSPESGTLATVKIPV